MNMRLKGIGVIFLLSISVVVLLYQLATPKINRRFDFLRNIKNDALAPMDTVNVRYNSYAVAYVADDSIYLKNTMNPYHVLFIRLHDKDTVHINLSTFPIQNFHPQVEVLLPNIFLVDGTIPEVLKASIKTRKTMQYMVNSAYFVEYIPVSEYSAAVRSLTNGEYALGKQMTDTPYVWFNRDLLQKQVDGIFCTDGMLRYNRELNRLVYTYFYRNEFIQLDTSLVLISRNKTIDPIDTAQIEITYVKTDNTRTHSKPPLRVNNRTFTSGKWLFVQSALMAKNDREDLFRTSPMIDVYDLTTSRYKFSFYVPSFGGIQMRDFGFHGSSLIVLYERHLVSYKLSFK